MSGKTKAELLAEVALLKRQIAVKNDHIETLEYLLKCEERENHGLRLSNEVGRKAYEGLHIGRLRSEWRNFAKRAYYLERFVFHFGNGLTPFKSETHANRDVAKKFGKIYEKSSLYAFRAKELKKYFPRRKHPLER
jgi:hypothetical protein